MKANELRIGNLIRYCDPEPQDYYTIEVNGISEFTGQIIPVKDINGMEGEEWSIESFEPIPLTEEWLLKFGFEKALDSFLKGTIELNYITTDENFQFEFTCPVMNWAIIDLKHVHQLQNLFFALTGEELTIK